MDDAVLAVLVGIMAFVGSALGHWVSRKGAVELDRWRRREESLRLLRWSVEMAIDSAHPSRQRAGILALDALYDSPLLDDDDVDLVVAITEGLATAPS